MIRDPVTGQTQGRQDTLLPRLSRVEIHRWHSAVIGQQLQSLESTVRESLFQGSRVRKKSLF